MFLCYVFIKGCHMFSKMRPVDQLRHLLDNSPDAECQVIENFFRIYDVSSVYTVQSSVGLSCEIFIITVYL